MDDIEDMSVIKEAADGSFDTTSSTASSTNGDENADKSGKRKSTNDMNMRDLVDDKYDVFATSFHILQFRAGEPLLRALGGFPDLFRYTHDFCINPDFEIPGVTHLGIEDRFKLFAFHDAYKGEPNKHTKFTFCDFRPGVDIQTHYKTLRTNGAWEAFREAYMDAVTNARTRSTTESLPSNANVAQLKPFNIKFDNDEQWLRSDTDWGTASQSILQVNFIDYQLLGLRTALAKDDLFEAERICKASTHINDSCRSFLLKGIQKAPHLSSIKAASKEPFVTIWKRLRQLIQKNAEEHRKLGQAICNFAALKLDQSTDASSYFNSYLEAEQELESAYLRVPHRSVQDNFPPEIKASILTATIDHPDLNIESVRYLDDLKQLQSTSEYAAKIETLVQSVGNKRDHIKAPLVQRRVGNNNNSNQNSTKIIPMYLQGTRRTSAFQNMDNIKRMIQGRHPIPNRDSLPEGLTSFEVSMLLSLRDMYTKNKSNDSGGNKKRKAQGNQRGGRNNRANNGRSRRAPASSANEAVEDEDGDGWFE